MVTKTVTPSEEYFYHHVLAWSGGIEEMGVINWSLMGALALVWLLAGLALIRGIQSLGKVGLLSVKVMNLSRLYLHSIVMDGSEHECT